MEDEAILESENVTGEIEVVIHPHDEDSQDDVINLGDSGMEAVTDEDPGFEIVTEDKGTNCPSLNGSLRKESKKEAPKIVADEIKEESVVDEPVQEQTKASMKKWTKLMKYTLPSKNPESKQNKKNKEGKEGKERKSLKDKMKENELVAFLTERRAVSESRFRVLDKLGEGKPLTKTKSEQSLDEGWSTGITTGRIFLVICMIIGRVD